MTPRQNAIEHARISRRFGLFWARLAKSPRTKTGHGHNRAFDLWMHYVTKARTHLRPMTMREQLEALGWTRRNGQTIRKGDLAVPAYVACDPAVNSVQQWILMGCPAVEVARVA